MVVVDETGEDAGPALPHTDLIVLPSSCVHVLLQAHQTPGQNKQTNKQTDRHTYAKVVISYFTIMSAAASQL